MALTVRTSAAAEADLEKQYEWYCRHADVDVAERYQKAFDLSVAALALHPDMGVVRNFKPQRLRGIRSYRCEVPFDVHLVFYRADAETLFIERVIHGARNLPRRVRE